MLEEKKPQGNAHFFWHGRVGESYYSLSDAKIQEIKLDVNNFLSYIRDNSEVRDIAADELGVASTVEKIRNKLPSNDFNELVQTFDKIVKRIRSEKNVDPKDRGYEEMGWRRNANQYMATPQIQEV